MQYSLSVWALRGGGSEDLRWTLQVSSGLGGWAALMGSIQLLGTLCWSHVAPIVSQVVYKVN